MASDKIARAMSVQNGLEITTKIGELSSEIDSNSSVIVETEKYATSLGNTKDGLLTINGIKGNTIQNLSAVKVDNSGYFNASVNNNYYHQYLYSGSIHYTDSLLLEGKQYTVVYEQKNIISGLNLQGTILFYTENGVLLSEHQISVNTPRVLTVPSGAKKIGYRGMRAGHSHTTLSNGYRFMVLEGDWSNKEIPIYFEGIKSVGEESGKIDISLLGENLLDVSKPIYHATGKLNSLTDGVYDVNSGSANGAIYFNVKKNMIDTTKELRLSFEVLSVTGENRWQLYAREVGFGAVYGNGSVVKNGITTLVLPPNTVKKDFMFLIYVPTAGTDENIKFKNPVVSYIDTIYSPYVSTLVNIPISEPLRSLPNGVKDEIVNGKLIRRVGKVILNGSENWTRNGDIQGYGAVISGIAGDDTGGSANPIISDKLTTSVQSHVISGAGKNIIATRGGVTSKVYIRLDETYASIENLRQWLANNNVTLYYELATPIETILTPPIPSAKVYKNGTLIINNGITPTLNVSATSNVSSKVYNIETELTRAVTSNNNAWQTLMILADKELRMKSLSLLTTESTTDLKNKINEMINIWR